MHSSGVDELSRLNKMAPTKSNDTDRFVVIDKGNIYINAALYEKYFRGLDSVAILRREMDIILMPLHHDGGGGLLLKIKNARGDRVIHAREFLASLEIDESLEIASPVCWDTDLAGLRLTIS